MYSSVFMNTLLAHRCFGKKDNILLFRGEYMEIRVVSQ